MPTVDHGAMPGATVHGRALPYERDGGRLGPLERWRLALQSVRARLATRRRARRGAVVSTHALDARALDHLEPPPGPLAPALLAWTAQQQPPWLQQHVLRTYAWSSLLALTRGVPHERELLFAACLLHDLGLTPVAATPADDCFALRGARAARDWLAAHGMAPERAHACASAITLHLDAHVPRETGAEAHLLQAGAALDVLGTHRRELPATWRDTVLARHPRAGFKQALCSCMRDEAARAPRTRIGLYVDRFGFLDLIEKAPFDG
jgi:hypothetical protein